MKGLLLLLLGLLAVGAAASSMEWDSDSDSDWSTAVEETDASEEDYDSEAEGETLSASKMRFEYNRCTNNRLYCLNAECCRHREESCELGCKATNIVYFGIINRLDRWHCVKRCGTEGSQCRKMTLSGTGYCI